jgi:hypothetical protein
MQVISSGFSDFFIVTEYKILVWFIPENVDTVKEVPL